MATSDNARYVPILLYVLFLNKCNMVTQFNEYLVKGNLTKNTIRSMDGEVFYGALQGGEQTKPFGVQGVFGGELQATNS